MPGEPHAFASGFSGGRGCGDGKAGADRAPELELHHARASTLEADDTRSRQARQDAFHTLIRYAPEAIVLLDVQTGRFLDANPTAERIFGIPRAALLESGPFDLSPSWQPSGLSSTLGKEKIAAAASGRATTFEWWHRNARGERFPCEVHLVKVPWGAGDVIWGTILDNGVRKRLELSEQLHRRVLDTIAKGLPLSDAFSALVRTTEELLPGMICSVLLFESRTKRLRVAAAPSLPAFYNLAVDGLAIGPTVGSCGAAAFTGRRVVVSDISSHSNWLEFRQLAGQAGLKACWSEPILSFSGQVLGTFAMYYREPAEPAPIEVYAIENAAQLASLAMEHAAAQTRLRALNAELELRVAKETQHLLEANRRLRAAQEDLLLAAVAFQTHDSMMITDKNGSILRVNESFTRLTGYAQEEVIGKNPRILKSGRHGQDFYAHMWSAIHNNGYWEGEIWDKSKDGEVIPEWLKITAVKNVAGATTHYVADAVDMRGHRQAALDRMEINAARKIQESLLPRHVECADGLDIAGAVYPSASVSGDCFDILTKHHCVSVFVADVSGHGVGPALVMAQTQAYLRAVAEAHDDPGRILSHVNQLLAASPTGRFVTLLLAVLNPERRTLRYASAGHRGWLIRNSGGTEVLDSDDLPLGVAMNVTISSSPELTLAPGDIIVLPTDGVEETIGPEGTMFGDQRMLEVVRRNRDASASEIAHHVLEAARDFAHGEPQYDDMTVVIVKFRGSLLDGRALVGSCT